MTVTTPVAALTAAAAREHALGNYAYADALWKEARDNAGAATAVQAASAPQISPALVGYFTTTLQSSITSISASKEIDRVASHVQPLKGHDGSTLTG
jgi:homospermidine synthase